MEELVYNNILRKKKANKKMNYSFDIQPFSTTLLESVSTASNLVSQRQKAVLKGLKAPKKFKVKISSFSWSKT
jgi:hypothetical protein